jgi:uncharacterized protein YaaR (DUF327 family)
MANWKYQINLSDIFEKVEDQPIETTAMEIYQRFATFMENHSEMFEDEWDIEDTIDNLKYCESVEEIDGLLVALYDFADQHRIWVNTWEIA